VIWDICIRRPVFTAMLILAPVVLGFASYTRLGVELFPNVDVPVVVVTTTLKGASVEEMEVAVTKPLEEAVNTVSGIDELRSTTREGVTEIVVGFKLEKDGNIAAQEIRDKMSLIQSQLPPGTEYPKVEKFNLDAAPVVTLAISGKRSLREITEITRKLLKEDLEANCYGVGAVVLVGGQQRAIQVTVDPTKLQSRDLSIENVRQALLQQNLELPGGRIDTGRREINLRTPGRLKDVSEFEELVVGYRNGHAVRLYEVAGGTGRGVVDGIEEPRGLSRLDGDSAVSLVIQKQSGGNTVKVAEAVKARLAVIAPTLPPDIHVEIIRDQSKFINGSIDEVKFHLVLAAILVSGVLLMFIRNWRTTVIAALAVPTSIIGTFAFMDIMGFSLNNMTLLGLILAVGIVIDDAVVVLENVIRHMEEYGSTPLEAASKATKEIALAVLATTLSLAVIFAPIAFMSGQIGRFFNSFGFVVGFAVLLSMFVSFTLTPMLCAWFLKPLPPNSGHKGKQGFWAWVDRRYVTVLRWCLGGKWGWHRGVVVAAAFATLLSTPVLFEIVGTDFVPKDDQSEFEVSLTLPAGTTLTEADDLCRDLEGKLKNIRGVQNIFTTIGETNGRSAKGQGDVCKVQFYCRMIDLKKRNYAQKDSMNDARVILADYVDYRAAVQEVKLFSSSAFKNVQLDIAIRGPDTAVLEKATETLKRKLSQDPAFADVDTTRANRSPELQVSIDRIRAGDLGVNVQTIASTLGILVGGEPVSKFKDGVDQYDVWLRADLPSRNRSNAVREITVPNRDGKPVELGNLASLRIDQSPAAIERFNRQRYVSVQANLTEGQALGKVLPKVQKEVEALNLPPEYRYEFLGEAKLMADSNSNFALAFFLAFIFMYMILAAQFESLVHPITILMAVPLTLPFALVSLMLLRTPLDVYAMIGLFMLFGIVKKNGILQVDYTNVLRRKGLERNDAILQANEARLRPILMTTIMLVAAMIPIASGRGPGASARASMAKVILGGQLLSLFLSLLITPVAYSLWDDIAGMMKRVVGRLRRKPIEATTNTDSAPNAV
jgi:HAE1 family hydrophobic/amphiphilic exporter-1